MGLDGACREGHESSVCHWMQLVLTWRIAPWRDPKSGASANSATFALLVFPGTARILNASALAFHDPVPRSGAHARTLDCMAQLSTSPEDWNERAALFNYRCRGC